MICFQSQLYLNFDKRKDQILHAKLCWLTHVGEFQTQIVLVSQPRIPGEGGTHGVLFVLERCACVVQHVTQGLHQLHIRSNV